MTSPLPLLKDEIFISYAHADNEILPGQTQGWVSIFDDALRALLKGKISPEVKIWRDIELGKNDFVTDTLLDQVSSIAVMVSILSPRYLDSEWCLRELNHFCQAAEQKNFSLKVAKKSRIIKVQKYPLHKDPPEVFADLDGFEFYEIDRTNRPTEYRLEFGPDSSVKFYLKVNGLADEIRSVIEAIRDAGNAETLNDASVQRTPVYLAETTSDLEAARSNIKSDLVQRNYKVLPDRSPSYKASDFKEQVEADLEQCKLSIHLVGEEYGFCPDGENRSIIELQHDMAIERNQHDADFTRIIWMPEFGTGATRLEDIRRRRLADRITSTLFSNTELLQTSLEDLKTVIQDKLNPPTKSAALLNREREVPLVFVICDRVDLDGGRKLDDSLYGLGYDVALPSMDGNETQVHEDFQKKLLLSDAVIIYRDQAPDFWVQTKLRELQKIRSQRGPNPFLVEAVYIGGQKTEEKERFRTRQALLIKNYGNISSSSLKPFLDLIEQKRREQAS